MKSKPIIIIFLTVFLYLLGFGIVIPIIPLLSRDFGATALESGLLMSIYSLMQFIFAPFWGRLSDKYGRRPIILICLVGEGLSYILFAHANTLLGLFIARFFAGLFSGSISTASAYISDITPPEKRSSGMAIIGAAFGLGFVFGPALGGVLVLIAQRFSTAPHFEAQFCAYFVAALCFANFIFGFFKLKESRDFSATVTKKESRLQLLTRYFKNKTVSPLLVIFLLSSLSMAIMEATLILFMKERFNWDLKTVSFGFAYIGVTIVFTQGYLIRKILPIYGEKQIMRIGLLLMAIGLGGIGFASNILWMAVLMTLLGLGSGMVNPATMGSISLLATKEEQGLIMGVTQSMSSLGRIIGPAFGGFLFGALHIEAPFLASGLLALSAFIIVVIIFSRLPEASKKI